MSKSNATAVHSKDLPPHVPNQLMGNLKSKLFTVYPRPPPSTDLTSQTIIITGAASGLGRETAKQLLGFKLSHLIIAARTVNRGQATADELQTAYPKAKIEVWALEMELYESVQAFAKRCDSELTRLDAVILNAGMADMEMKLTSSGHEKIMQVNYWSTALLGILLLPIMKAKKTSTTSPRLTIISSDMAAMCKAPMRKEVPFLSTFDDEKWWNYAERYGESKLVGQLFFPRLAEHISPDDVIINLVEPGFIKGTDLLRNAAGLIGLVFSTLRALFAHPIEHGGWTYVDAAVVRGKDSHGDLLNKGKVGA